MANSVSEEIQRDDLAMSVAQALATANAAATAEGADLPQSLVTITEESPPPERKWRIHYGPRDYQNRRGGDLIFVVDATTGRLERTIRGQ